MNLSELHNHETLNEGQLLLADSVIDQILEHFNVFDNTPLFEEDGGGDISMPGDDLPADSTTPDDTKPTTPSVAPPGGAWFGGFGGSLWFNTFVRQMRWLVTSKNVKNRLKELGIKGDSIKRIDNQIKMASKHVDSLLSNPMQFHIKQFTYDSPKQQKQFKDKMNNAVKSTIKKNLVKLPKGLFLPGSK